MSYELEPISPELEALGQQILDESFYILVQDRELWPLALYETLDGEQHCVSFSEDEQAECLLAARAYLKQQKNVLRYVLSYDGLIQGEEDSELYPAVIFEFAERGMSHAYSGYCAYQLAQDGKDFLCSAPKSAGIEESLL